jgi:hypothetical protein
MDAYIATLFEGEDLGLVLRAKVAQKARSKSEHKSHEHFCIKKSIKDPSSVMINHVLIMRQGSKVGTLHPCWDLGP